MIKPRTTTAATWLRTRRARSTARVAALGAGVLVAATLVSPAQAGGQGTLMAWSRASDAAWTSVAIVARPVGGTVTRTLTHPARGQLDVDPAISPDGRWVAFERDHPDGRAVIGLVRTDGSGEHVLDVCHDPCVADLAPTWTPDGRIAFARVSGLDLSLPDPTAESAVLWTMEPDGTGLTRLSEPGIDGAFEDARASFAPGGYVVFVRIRNADGHLAVFRMAPDGTDVRRLTPWSLDADTPWVSPATSGPTEDLVVFETYGHGAPEGTAQALATVPASCISGADCEARIRMLTSSQSLPLQSFNPTWSPDGRRIAYCRFEYGSRSAGGDIWTMRWDGSDARAFTSSPAIFDFRPAWGVRAG